MADSVLDGLGEERRQAGDPFGDLQLLMVISSGWRALHVELPVDPILKLGRYMKILC
jgi:hypothetical protein